MGQIRTTTRAWNRQMSENRKKPLGTYPTGTGAGGVGANPVNSYPTSAETGKEYQEKRRPEAAREL